MKIDIKKYKELEERSNKGPWECKDFRNMLTKSGIYSVDKGHSSRDYYHYKWDECQDIAMVTDLELIVQMRNDLPKIIKILEHAKIVAEELKEISEAYNYQESFKNACRLLNRFKRED